MVYEQWLRADLRNVVTRPCIPSSVTDQQITTITGHFIVQVCVCVMLTIIHTTYNLAFLKTVRSNCAFIHLLSHKTSFKVVYSKYSMDVLCCVCVCVVMCRLRPNVLQNLPIILFCSAHFNYLLFPVLLPLF